MTDTPAPSDDTDPDVISEVQILPSATRDGYGLPRGLIIALGIAAGVVTYVLHRQALLATVLGIALAVNFLVAALVGSLIPLVLRWLRADPAVASSVFVTACTDMCGFLVFLGLLSLGMRLFA